VLAKGKPVCFKTTAVLPTHTVKSGKNHGSDIGKKTSTYKVKDPLTFEKCIFRNGQPIILVFCVLCLLRSVLRCPLRFPHINRFVFYSGCLWERSFLVCFICVCLRVVLSNTYCVVFLFSFSSGGFRLVLRFSPLIKTDRYDITEILLKVAFNTITQTLMSDTNNGKGTINKTD
jgi:hypothetical protein